jgi:hypothetical protein
MTIDDADEFSESGQPIYRHSERKPFEVVGGDEESISIISAHLEKTVGEIQTVLHEIISDTVHVDVYVIAPAKGRNYYTLVTSGMSDRPMSAPPGMEEFRFAEVAICLPPGWWPSQSDFENENNYWPIRLLKDLARLPHLYDSWLSFGHTIQNGDPSAPYAPGTKLCAALLSPPIWLGIDFGVLKVSDEKTIHFLSVVPIYKEEMTFKLKHSSEELFKNLYDAGFAQVVNPGRKNICAAKRRGFLSLLGQ